MKKILTVLILLMFILIGFRTIAIPHEKSFENDPLNMKVFSLEVIVEGGFLGYAVTIINTGTERVQGNFSIEILTDAMVVLFGANMSKERYLDLNPLNGLDTFKIQPLIGFGSATINIKGFFKDSEEEYPFEEISNGYAFVIYLICDETSISLP